MNLPLHWIAFMHHATGRPVESVVRIATRACQLHQGAALSSRAAVEMAMSEELNPPGAPA